MHSWWSAAFQYLTACDSAVGSFPSLAKYKVAMTVFYLFDHFLLDLAALHDINEVRMYWYAMDAKRLG